MMRVNETETKRLLEAVKPAKLVAATKYIDEKEAIEIVLNDSEETLIYHKSPEEECFTKEALKHETINFDKESKMEEDLDELEK